MQRINVGKQGKFPELKNTQNVVTRFPPEPSGWLHIGHAKALYINYYYAQHYCGEMRIRFDDTNPTKEKQIYVEQIIKDLEYMSIPTNKITFSSDYFDLLLNHAICLIKNDDAYVETLDKLTIKKLRNDGFISPCRNNTIQENLTLFDEMVNGQANYILRIKYKDEQYQPMMHKNKSLRDPAIYRVITDIEHFRTQKKYNVYPLYDFTCAILDSVEGITHAFRSNEYHDKNMLYEYIQKICGLRKVEINDFSRLNISHTIMSKRKLQKLIDESIVDSWESPLLPTIRGFKKCGVTRDAIKLFVESQGLSKNITSCDVKKLYDINKKIIDPISKRYFAVTQQNYQLVVNDRPINESNIDITLLIDENDALNIVIDQ